MSRLCLLALLVCALPARADVKPLAANVGVDERVGGTLPLDLRVTDQRGNVHALGDFIGEQGKPVLLALAYYHCPGLCDISLRELASRLRDLRWKLGSEYSALTLSIDPHDTPAAAAAKRSSVLTLLRAPPGEQWPFLVAAQPDIQRLTRALGYRYDYDAATRQYAHPAVSVVLTPAGVIARYVYGPTIEPATLKLALREARAGRGGTSSLIDRTVLSCFRYDPASHRYEWLILGVMRIGAALIAALLLGAILVFRHKGRVRRAEPREA
ncbi:MAG TPA: SCO family protein [Polyangiales bacterium]|nr:SCO family protein [Polyangiales bacterium]